MKAATTHKKHKDIVWRMSVLYVTSVHSSDRFSCRWKVSQPSRIKNVQNLCYSGLHTAASGLTKQNPICWQTQVQLNFPHLKWIKLTFIKCTFFRAYQNVNKFKRPKMLIWPLIHEGVLLCNLVDTCIFDVWSSLCVASL